MGAKVEGLKELDRKLARLGNFPKEMRQELRASNRRIGRIGARAVKNTLPRQSKEFVVYEKGSKGIGKKGTGKIDRIIPAGTLKRSIRVWNVRRSKINVHMGVKTGGSVRFDGYFVRWVEGGNVGRRRRTIGSKFYDAVTPRLERISGRMQRIQLVAYRRIFNQFARKVK